MVAAALDDPATGVNAQLALMTFSGGDVRPADMKAILNEADHNTEIRERPAPGWPVQLVEENEQGTTADPEAVVGYRDGNVSVIISNVTESTASKAWRESKFWNEATVRAVDRGLLAPDKIGTKGLKDNIQIMQATRLTSPRVERELGLGTILNPVIYSLNYRDNAP